MTAFGTRDRRYMLTPEQPSGEVAAHDLRLGSHEPDAGASVIDRGAR